MRALSIRQPFAELILRGIKTVEYRSRPTRIIGERFWIYASKTPVRAPDSRLAAGETGIWSRDLAMSAPPPWILELATALRLFKDELPTGLIVGSAVIDKVSPAGTDKSLEGMYRWHLSGVERAARPRKPDRHPQPVWFEPF